MKKFIQVKRKKDNKFQTKKKKTKTNKTNMYRRKKKDKNNNINKFIIISLWQNYLCLLKS